MALLPGDLYELWRRRVPVAVEFRFRPDDLPFTREFGISKGRNAVPYGSEGV